MRRPPKRFVFFGIYLFTLFLYTCMFPACCFHQRICMPEGLIKGAINQS